MGNRNKILIIISVVCSFLAILGVTYAAWTFSTEKTDITMTIDGDQVNFNAGGDLTISGMLPVYTMEDGEIKDVEIYKTNDNYNSSIVLYLKLTTWNAALSSSSFRWAIYKNGNYLSSGDFSGLSQGNVITLTPSQKLNIVDNKDTYRLYLWLDAYQESNINMMNKTFTVSLYGQTTFYTEEDPIVEDTTPNAPDLIDGMIPIRYNYMIDEWVKADSSNTNNDWYDYNNKYWANAVLVTSESRTNYMNATVGTTVNEDDILAYYVWIPRYRYVLFNVNSTEGPSEIQIEFQKTTDEISSGTQNGEYLTHPAFTWDGEALDGFWVGKFATGGSTATPYIKPNIVAITNPSVSGLFDTIRKFGSETYMTGTGLSNSDSHMIKNTEWGAVAYLSHSRYGANKELCINNSSTYITGRSGGATSKSATVAGNYTYDDYFILEGGPTTNKEAGLGACASTTGNITGVYDMFTSNFREYVMGVMKDASGNIFYNSSGFKVDTMPESKYYNLYEYGSNSSDYTRMILGDATGETASWYSAYRYFVASSNAWFYRGAVYTNAYANAFDFNFSNGGGNQYSGTRAVLISD